MKKIISLISIFTMVFTNICYAESADVIKYENSQTDEIVSEYFNEENFRDVENDAYDASIYDNEISRDEFLKSFYKEHRPLDIVDNTFERDVKTVKFKGENCFFLHEKKKYLYGKVPENISSAPGNVAVKITFYDRYIDYVRYTYMQNTGSTRNVLVCKNGTNSWKTETILIDNGDYNRKMKYDSDFYVNSYDKSLEMGNDYVKDIEFINLDTECSDTDKDGNKKNILGEGTLSLMSAMGFFDENMPLEKPCTKDMAVDVFKKITGKTCNLSSSPTVGETLDAFSYALGFEGGSTENYVKSGILKNLKKHDTSWFGKTHYKIQNHGLYDISMGNPQRKLYNDDICMIAYNLLSMEENGESYLKKLCEDEDFFMNMAKTNDRNLVYKYYYEAGFRVREKERIDPLTGNKIHEFYLPGGNLNLPYINEYTTIDNENYVFCAGLDKQVNRGYPVVYNTKTKETTTIDFTQMRSFGTVLSKDNIVYYTAEDCLKSYDIKTGEKKILWREPEGKFLQEVPTITNDGRYICIFYGTINQSHPDTIGVFDTQNDEMKTYLGKEWIENNFYGPEPIFAGHVIINPERPELIQFLHGGPKMPEDRMWLLYTDTLKTLKRPPSPRRFDGGMGEQSVHWIWSINGKKLYYIRMANTLADRSGIVYYDPEKDEEGVILVNGDYPYTHATPNIDDSLIVADTLKTPVNGFYKSEIVLYDYVTDTTRLLAVNSSWSGHPCHSHPVFSKEGNYVLYNSGDENNLLCKVCMIDVVDIVEDIRKNGDTKHYEKARLDMGNIAEQSTIRAKIDIENGTAVPALVNGEKCFYFDNKKNLCCDVDGQYVKADDENVIIRLTYFDNGTEPFYLDYNSNFASEVSTHKNARRITIPKRNTNKWVTKTIKIDNAAFRGALYGSYDFVLLTNSKNENVYIKSIEANSIQ